MSEGAGRAPMFQGLDHGLPGTQVRSYTGETAMAPGMVTQGNVRSAKETPTLGELLPAVRESLTRAWQMAEALEQRLQPILIPGPMVASPTGSNGPTPAAFPGASQVVNDLADIGRGIEALNQRLATLRAIVQL